VISHQHIGVKFEMKLRNSLLALAIAGLSSGTAFADPWTGNFNTGVTNHDGALLTVNGFDIYAQGSSAFFCAVGTCGGVGVGNQLDPAAPNVLALGDVVTTYYQGVVNAFAGTSTPYPNLDYPTHDVANATSQYQLTIAAKFDEVVSGFSIDSFGFAHASLQPLTANSRVSMFFDDSTLSNTFISNTAGILAGAGYTDGLMFADGTVDQFLSLPTNYVATGTAGNGNATVTGPLSLAQLGVLPDTIGFMPDAPNGYTSTTTLQFGGGIATDYQTMSFFDSANGWNPQAANYLLTERADANVDLTKSVPEPATLTLLGLGLAGLGFGQRRRAPKH
jgi:hypothetical protein